MRTPALYLTLVASLAAASLPATARDTLIDMDNARSGGYGGPLVKFGPLGDDDAILLGGEGAATFTSGDHSLLLGGAGYGLVNEPAWSGDRTLDLGYGGLLLGYTHRPDQLVHLESKVLLGAGSVSLIEANGADDDGRFLVSEVSLTGEVNLTDFLEIGVGGAYRFASDPAIDGVSASDLSGPSLILSFQFGQI